MKKLSLVVCLSAFFSFAQQSTKFHGLLLNKKNNQPIAFAHFQFNAQGFISDRDGKFNVHLNTSLDRVEVRISALGFKNQKTTLYRSEKNVVHMEPKAVALQEVVLDYEDPAVALVKKVIKNIPKNYPNEFEQLYGEYNENVYWDSLGTRPIYKVKVMTRADKFPYDKKNMHGNVEIIDKDVQLFNLDSLRVRFYAGIHIMHTDDYVMRRKNFLILNKIKRYNLNIQDTLKFNNREVIALSFKNKLVGGVAYIDLKTFALVRLERFIDAKEIKKPLDFLSGYERQYYHEIIDYERGEDQKYRINVIHSRAAFKHLKSSRTINAEGTYFLTKTEKGENVILENKRILFEDVLLHKIDLDSALSQNKRQHKKEKWFRFFTKIQYSYAFVVIPLRTHAHRLLVPSLGIDKSIDASKIDHYSLQTRMDYKITNTLGIQFSKTRSFSKKEYVHTVLGVWKKGELNTTGLWRYELASSINYRKMRINHGQVTTSETVVLNGKEFDSGRIEYFSEQRDFGWSVSMQLKYRLSNSATWGVFGRYLHPIGGKSGFYAREKGEFWPWKREGLFDESFLNSTSQPIMENYFQYGVSLIFRL